MTVPGLSLSPSMSDFMSIREAGNETVSADGALVAYLSNETGLNQIWIRPAINGRPDGPARQLTDLPERVTALAFAPKGRDLVFTTDCGMDERHQIWLIPEASGMPRPLTQAPERVHVWGCWSPEADRIAFASNERDATMMDIHVMVLATGERRCVWQGSGYAEPLAFAADGRLLIRDSQRSMRDQDLLWLNPESGEASPLLPHADPAQYFSVKLDPDGVRAIVLTDQDSDVTRPCLADLAKGELTPLHEVPGWEIDKVAVSPDRDRVACVVNREGITRIELLDIASGEVADLGAPAMGVVSSLSFIEDGKALLMSFAGPAEPSALWTGTLDGDFARVTGLPRAGIAPGMLAAPELHRFDSFDGLSVPYFIYPPAGSRPEGGWPVLFMVHGGPESQWKAGFRPDLNHYLQSGIMVVAPNVRGSSGYGRRYCAADDREKRMDPVRDLIALRDLIAARPDTDAGRIGVMGQSYGGFMVLAAMTEAPDKWRCGVDIYGVSNFTTLMLTTGPWRRRLRAAEYGDPVADAELLRELSPINRISRIGQPLLVIHASDDPRVPIEQGEQVHAALRGLGRPVEYLRIEHEGHGFSRLANRCRVFETVASFLARRL